MTRLVVGVWLLAIAAALAIAGVVLVWPRVELDPFEEPYGDA